MLEGGRAAVNELHGRILRDPRHRDVTLLDDAEIGERRFATWRMGNVNLNRVNMGTILRSSESPALDPLPLSGRTGLPLLEELMATAALVSRDGGSLARRPGDDPGTVRPWPDGPQQRGIPSGSCRGASRSGRSPSDPDRGR